MMLSLFASKYLSPEPTAALGSEQTSGDSTPPTITFVSPTPANNSNLNQNWSYINISSSETLSMALLEWNNVNESMNGSGTNWYFNKTALADGTYSFRVWANDTANNWNKSETRSVTISTVTGEVYTKQFTVQSGISKLTASAIWESINASYVLSIRLVDPSGSVINQFDPGTTTRTKVTETVIPLPGLNNYNVTKWEGSNRISITSPASGNWQLQVINSEISQFEADVELS